MEILDIKSSNDDIRASSIIPEAKDTLISVREELKDSEFAMSNYGHALNSLMTIISSNADESPEKQKEILHRQALGYIKKYGDGIKSFLKPELLEALNINE